ncbi:hypothetical protein NK6_2979 [Bradyrhizobium diazoefficiens]|uniref:Uncharacterized protein n=1 Tax=Bradyrhizobium diazoefficiens TaxID=1355477 RepID=A0A0E4FSZ3_9BRAD|nr:hypothetical protein NK6_2979 [Bradyrhizobium diazoefficiens]
MSGLSQFAAAGVATIRSPTRFHVPDSESDESFPEVVEVRDPTILCGGAHIE